MSELCVSASAQQAAQEGRGEAGGRAESPQTAASQVLRVSRCSRSRADEWQEGGERRNRGRVGISRAGADDASQDLGTRFRGHPPARTAGTHSRLLRLISRSVKRGRPSTALNAEEHGPGRVPHERRSLPASFLPRAAAVRSACARQSEGWPFSARVRASSCVPAGSSVTTGGRAGRASPGDGECARGKGRSKSGDAMLGSASVRETRPPVRARGRRRAGREEAERRTEDEDQQLAHDTALALPCFRSSRAIRQSSIKSKRR